MAKNKVLMALSAVLATALSLPTFAQIGSSGVYVGGQAGYGNTAYNRAAFIGAGIQESGIAGRVYLGDQFNPYVGLELGATAFAKADLSNDYGYLRTEQLDLLLRLGAPIAESGFRADVKLGAAVVFAAIKPSDAGKTFGFEEDAVSETRPVAGASFSYYFTPSFAMDLSYLHVFGNPKSESHPAPNNDLATLGVSYLFATL